MGSLTLKDITTALESTHVTPNGVSFAGKCLKLNTEDDAKPVIDAINECQELQYLNLEGNTLGVEASRAIAKALEQHPEFKQALWKDMFTGRMKTEIPIALQSLGNSLVTAGAHLKELDLSDNAFGPIGVQGLASLLCSSACYALEELRLNNNGLGIGGGKLLAGALLDCYKHSKQHGKALSLKVFIAGRNRLENDGAKALAEVFKTIGTLEEIAMPQNGIYHVGISALSEAFKHNKNLQILNLNDNTVGPKGSKSIANVLPYLKNLKEINFGDCLLKTKGAQYIAEGLKSCDKLEQVTLGYNEIKIEGGKDLVKAMSNKSNLKSLTLNGNQFGNQGVIDIKNLLKEMGKLNILGSLDENENSDSEDESVDSENDSNDDDDVEEDVDDVKPIQNDGTVKISISEFVSLPNGDNLLGLGDDRVNLLIKEAEQKRESYLEHFVPILMKVAALTAHKDPQVADISLKCAEELYKKLFSWAQEPDRVSVMNNSLLVHLGLIKSEDKKFKPTWNIEGCLVALRTVLKKNYVPNHTRNTLKVFMQRDIYNNKEFISLQKAILSIL